MKTDILLTHVYASAAIILLISPKWQLTFLERTYTGRWCPRNRLAAQINQTAPPPAPPDTRQIVINALISCSNSCRRCHQIRDGVNYSVWLLPYHAIAPLSRASFVTPGQAQSGQRDSKRCLSAAEISLSVYSYLHLFIWIVCFPSQPGVMNVFQ